MAQSDLVPICESVRSEVAPVVTCAVDVANVEIRHVIGTLRRRQTKQNTFFAVGSLHGMFLALQLARQQLRDMRSENDRLKVKNQRLAAALAETSLRGTEAHYLARHDPLTGLPNRLLLKERLQHGIAQAVEQQKQLALLFIDLDCFKEVNDRFGHTMGDRLLAAAAARIITACIRAEDIACRYGGDEFVVLLSNIDDAAAAAKIATKIRAHIRRPYSIDGNKFRIAASLGMALYPRDGAHCDALLQCADASMYSRKSNVSKRVADSEVRLLKPIGPDRNVVGRMALTRSSACVPQNDLPLRICSAM